MNHEKWLKKMGLLPHQIKEKRTKLGKVKVSLPNLKTEENYPLSNNIAGNGFKTDIITNLHKESPETQKAILDKASRIAPLFNKGPCQFITDGTDLSDVGKKK